jgi:site-specific DNA-methyltransferase (adenine-specific)/adenine-specific DNA-methyltransferase
VSKPKFDELDKDNRIWWGKSGNNRPGMKRFLSEVREGVVPQTLWPWAEVGSTRHAKQELSKVMEAKSSSDLFITPKPLSLMQRILALGSEKDSLILDSFAGSGTTAHAVLAQNAADGGTRRFITVEMDEGICRDVTAHRLRNAVNGYGDTPGLGSGFRYCTLGAPLFDAHGNIASEVKFSDLAAHVYFTETGSPIPKRADGKTPLLGLHQGRAIYLLFNGVMGDKRPDAGNVLTHDMAADLPKHPAGRGPRIVYGEACRLQPKTLDRLGITFRQVPFELRVN